jgi:hypothetical protein
MEFDRSGRIINSSIKRVYIFNFIIVWIL